MFCINIFHWPLYTEDYEKEEPTTLMKYGGLRFNTIEKARKMVETLALFQRQMMSQKPDVKDIRLDNHFNDTRPHLLVIVRDKGKDYILSRYEIETLR